MGRVTITDSAPPSVEYYRGENSGNIYQKTSNGCYLNLNNGYIENARGGLTPLPIGTVITIQVTK